MPEETTEVETEGRFRVEKTPQLVITTELVQVLDPMELLMVALVVFRQLHLAGFDGDEEQAAADFDAAKPRIKALTSRFEEAQATVAEQIIFMMLIVASIQENYQNQVEAALEKEEAVIQ